MSRELDSRSDAFVGDISIISDNVTYEVGFAIGLEKPIRLIRSEHFDFKQVRDIGLLDTLGHDTYGLESTLIRVFQKPDENAKWPEITKSKDQPIFLLSATQSH